MTTESIVVTIDVGGSACKAYAFDLASGSPVAWTRVPHPPYPLVDDDAAEYEAEDWWCHACEALETLVDTVGVEPGRYLGITVGAARGPFVLLDHEGKVVGPTLLNVDRRSRAHVVRICNEIGASALYRVTGQWPASQWGLPRVLWVRDRYPDVWKATRNVLQLHDWVVFRLSGAMHSEPSSAAMSQMLDVTRGEWADELLGALGLPVALLPSLVAGGTAVGGLLPEVAARTGLPSGLPVHAGAGDTHLSTMSVGSASRSRAVVVTGSTTPVQLVCTLEREQVRSGALHPRLVSEHPSGTAWTLETNAGPTGSVVRRLVGLVEETDVDLAEVLTARGFDVVATSGDSTLTVLAGNPIFGPESWWLTPKPTVVGLRAEHTIADVRVAAERGACLAVASVLKTLELGFSNSVGHEGVTVTGGASESSRWCQALSDAIGREVEVFPQHALAGLAGAALVSGQDPVPLVGRLVAHAYSPGASLHSDAELDDYITTYRRVQRAHAEKAG